MDGTLSAPDALSAAAIARLQNAPVEVLAERTEFGSVFILPDGTRAAGVASGPVWVRRGGDGTRASDWSAVDLTLKVASDGSVRPVAQVGDLTLSGGSSQTSGSVDLAAVTDSRSGARASVQWQGALPTPELSGRRATYRDVKPGVDLVVEATNTGFQQFMVVKQRPAPGTDLSFPTTMTLTGADLSSRSDGTLVATADGKTVAEAGAPQMWDATTDLQTDDPITKPRAPEDPSAPRLAPMPAWVISKEHSAAHGDSTPAGKAPQASAGNGPRSDKLGDVAGKMVKVDRDVKLSGNSAARVGLNPADTFLQDPATTYPVGIDPDVNLNWGFDTWVQNGYSTPHPTDTKLLLGYPGSAGHQARAFITFPLTNFVGATVSGARFEMFNYYSWSCQSRNWEVWSTSPASASTTWGTQPAWYTHYATSGDTHGYSASCPGAWDNADVTQLAKDWAAGASGGSQGWIGLKAENEADSYGWKYVYSADNGAYIPSIWVTYNFTPDAPSGVKVSSPNSSSSAFATTTQPTLSATVSDRDGGNLAVAWRVWSTTGGALVWDSGYSAINVPSGTVASIQVPPGKLVDGGAYQVEAMAGDGAASSSWSPRVSFTVDSTPPGAPRVSSNQYPADDTWHLDANQAGTFSFMMSPADTTVVGYQWGLDQAPAASQQVNVTNGANGTLTITPTTVGRHILQVKTIDRAGNTSAQVTRYAFLVGKAGILAPEEGAKVVRRVQISVGTNDSNLTYVKYQWRRGPDSTTQTDIAPAALSASTGQPFGTGFNPVPAAGGYSTWDASMTLGYAGGPAQVRAALASDANGTGLTYTQWVTVTVDPNADGAASSDIGPGSVNLLTGDYKVTVTDAQEFGLSVLRTTSSRDTDSGYQLQPDLLSATQRDGSAANAGEFTPSGAAISSSPTQFHQGGSSLKLTATAAGWVDTFASVGSGMGTIGLGLVPGATYRMSVWVYVPSATGLVPGSARGESLTLFTRVGSGPYSEPSANGQMTPRPTVTDAWQQRTVDVTIPAGATEAFVRLYNGFDGSTGKVVYFDDLSIRRIWAPFGLAWSQGAADGTAGTAYTTISQPSDDVAAVGFATGGDVWFTRGNGDIWYPEPGAEGLKLTHTSSTSWRLTELDGTFTDFARNTSSGDFTVADTAPPAVSGQVRYVYAQVNGLQRLSRIIAPIEAGVDGWINGTTGNLQACATDTPAKGCEVLALDYAPTTTATTSALGDIAGQVQTVSAWVFNGTAMVKTVVAAYQYNASGQLVTVQDPRIATVPGSLPLVTTYSYDPAGRLKTITPAGELPYTFTYGVAGAQITGTGDWIDPSPGRLLTVARDSLQRDAPDQLGPTNTTSVVYAVPLTTTAGGPYDLSSGALETWAQSDGPTDATAIFGPQNPPGVFTASATTPGSGGYGPATVHYLNASGLEVDTASPAGPNAPAAGYIDVAEYDTTGKVTRTLDATNRLLALRQLPDSAKSLDELGLADKTSEELATLLDTRNTYSADGLDLLTVTGPADRLAVANNASDIRLLRPYTINVYDEGKPDGAAYHLVTTTTSSGKDAVTGDLFDTSVTVSGYDPIDGASPLGGTSGWLHATPTTVTVDSGGQNALTSKVLLDANGRPISSRMPGSSSADAGTVSTVYYTAAANPADAACGLHPEWAGQACTTSSAGPATGADPTRMSTSLPVKRVTGYDGYGNPTSVTESATGPVGGVTVTDTRTTVTSYDAAGRVTTVDITGAGAGAGGSVAKSNTVNVPATGEVAAVQSHNASGAVTSAVVKTYDKLGRLVTYTDAAGGSTTTKYDQYGRPDTVNESIGTNRKYTYDDPRGYVTSVTDSVLGGTITAAWGPDGQLTSETLPGDLTLTIGYDAARTPVTRTYTRTSDGTQVATDSGTLNQRGQWINRQGNGRSTSYGYDSIGRLVRVDDTSDLTGMCTRRIYAYDTHSNRTGFGQTSNVAGDPCPPEPIANISLTYDGADRLLTTSGSYGSAWTYDPFGRTTLMPTADGSATVANVYYVNNQIASQTQTGASRVSWTLDPIQRRSSVQTDQWVNNVWASSSAKVNHYATDSDEPAWINEDTTLPTAVTRYVSGVDGDLAATTSATGQRVMQLIDLHGDVMATVPIADGATTADWTGLRFTAFDEFGNPLDMAGGTAATGLTARYGWLGADQRSSDALGGVILMGQRLYLPTTGRFLSVDPVPGGSANAYDYCNADPVNCVDLDGTFTLGGLLKAVAVVADIASTFVPGPVGLAIGAVAVASYYVAGDKAAARSAAIGAAAALVGAGMVAGAVKLARVVKSSETVGRLAAHAAPKLERAVAAAKSGLDSAKTGLKKNNILRIGSVTTGSPFRVSIGAAKKYWDKFPAWRQALQPIHVHIEKRAAAIEYHPSGKTIVLWGKW